MARKECPERKVNPEAVRESFRKVGTGLSIAARQKRERMSVVASKTGSMISQAATSTSTFLSNGLQNAAARNNGSDGSNEVLGTENQMPEQPVTKTTTTTSTNTGGGWFKLPGKHTATPETANNSATTTPPPASAAAPFRLQQVAGKFAPFRKAMDMNFRQPTRSGGVAAVGTTGISLEGHDAQENDLF
jgi:hypothetical protein